LAVVTPPGRSTRDRPAKPALSREAVVDAGLHVLRAEGIDAVTMRRVAAALDTGPASLYVYVRNRQDLLNQMMDAVAGEIDVGDEPDPERWREQLVGLLTRVREAMDRHPGIARVPLANIPSGPNAVRVAERVLALMRAGGIEDRVSAWAVDVIFLYVNAAAYEASIYAEERGASPEVGEEVRDTLRAQFGALPADEFPNLVSMLEHLTSGDADERFAFGLQLMIEGLLHAEPPAA
jgi:AcrR family transcriptional regulator